MQTVWGRSRWYQVDYQGRIYVKIEQTNRSRCAAGRGLPVSLAWNFNMATFQQSTRGAPYLFKSSLFCCSNWPLWKTLSRTVSRQNRKWSKNRQWVKMLNFLRENHAIAACPKSFASLTIIALTDVINPKNPSKYRKAHCRRQSQRFTHQSQSQKSILARGWFLSNRWMRKVWHLIWPWLQPFAQNCCNCARSTMRLLKVATCSNRKTWRHKSR